MDSKTFLGVVLLCCYAVFTGILLVYQIPKAADVAIQIAFVVLFTIMTFASIKDLPLLNCIGLIFLAVDLALLIWDLILSPDLLGVLRLFRVAILVLESIKIQFRILQCWSLIYTARVLQKLALRSSSPSANKIQEAISIVEGFDQNYRS